MCASWLDNYNTDGGEFGNMGQTDAKKNWFGKGDEEHGDQKWKWRMQTQNKYRDTTDFWKPSYNSLRKTPKNDVAWTHLSDAGV